MWRGCAYRAWDSGTCGELLPRPDAARARSVSETSGAQASSARVPFVCRVRAECVTADELRRAPLPLGVLVPRRRLAPGGARAARAELGYDALALTDHDGVYGSLEFAARGEGVRRPADHRRRGDARTGGHHVTLLVESRARLREPLPAAHRGARRHTHGPKEGARAARRRRSTRRCCAELNEGLVCLSGCARHGLGVRDPNAAVELARAFGASASTSSSSGRSSAATRAGTRCCATSPRTLGVATVATGDVHAHHPRRTDLQDVLVAIRNRTSLDGCERERRGNHESVLARAGRDARALPASTATPSCAPSSSPSGSSST